MLIIQNGTPTYNRDDSPVRLSSILRYLKVLEMINMTTQLQCSSTMPKVSDRTPLYETYPENRFLGPLHHLMREL